MSTRIYIAVAERGVETGNSATTDRSATATVAAAVDLTEQTAAAVALNQDSRVQRHCFYYYYYYSLRAVN